LTRRTAARFVPNHFSRETRAMAVAALTLDVVRRQAPA
jgi:hypothetical protein